MDQKIINQFLRLNKLKFSKYETKNNILLVDRGNIDPIIRSSIAAEIFNKLKKSNVIVLLDDNKKSWSEEIYRSFGVKKFYRIPSIRKFYKFPLLFIKSILTFIIKYINFILFKDFRWFIDNFKIDNIHLGDLIYDSYLRYDLKFLNKKKLDIKFSRILFNSILKFYFIKNLILKNYVNQLIVNSATYVQNSSIALRIGVKKKIPSIFMAWFLVIFYDEYDRLFISRQKVLPEHIESTNLPENWFSLYEKYSKNRYLGKIEHPDFINAYKEKKIVDFQELLKSIPIGNLKFKKIVLIAPHAFSDASHESFLNLFDDFYDHFVSTLDHIKKNRHLDDVLWLVNPHPSSHVYNEEGLVSKIIQEYNLKNLKLFPQNLNVYSALKVVDTVITCNGTIGLEFPACFEKNAILAADAPYSGNKFNLEPKTKDEYFKYLDNIKNLKPMTNQEKVLAKKTFYFYECLMLESDITSIIPSNRFLKPEEFLNYIIKQLEEKDLKDDPFYNQIYNQIENHINKN